MRARLTPLAIRDIDEAVRYLLQDNMQVARSFRYAVLQTIAFVCEYPYTGIINARDQRFRSRIIPGFRYRIHYTVMNDALVIVHIRHTSRDSWDPKHE